MPKSPFWETEYFPGSHKHHVFGGANRKFSEEDKLYIYLMPKMHNMSDYGIHFNKDFMDYAHKIGQRTWQEYYSKTEKDFRKRYGKSYL